MAVSQTSPAQLPLVEQRLRGEKIALVDRLSGMPKSEAARMLRRHGATLVDQGDEVTLVVIGDNHANLRSALESEKTPRHALRDAIDDGRARLLRETELWHRLGLLDEQDGVSRLYTPAMLAELLQVPVTAIRRWHRQGTLRACRSMRRLPYFDFTEVAVARHLAALFHAGCSLGVIDRKLTELRRSLPDVERPLCDRSIVVNGRCLYQRRGDELAEPGGQLLIDFDKPSELADREQSSFAIPFERERLQEDDSAGEHSPFDSLQQEALDCEDRGEFLRAVECYRTLLAIGGPTAELHFSLADLLYRMGDLAAARERYFAAIEMDEEFVEARANLGCVLAELGDLELAIAAFEGALAFHPDYVDVHYHLAQALDRMGQTMQAVSHWQKFLVLAPDSPWAETAEARLSQEDALQATFSDSSPH